MPRQGFWTGPPKYLRARRRHIPARPSRTSTWARSTPARNDTRRLRSRWLRHSRSTRGTTRRDWPWQGARPGCTGTPRHWRRRASTFPDGPQPFEEFDARHVEGVGPPAAWADWKTRKRALTRANELNSNHADVRYNLGFVLMRRGHPERARLHLERAEGTQSGQRRYPIPARQCPAKAAGKRGRANRIRGVRAPQEGRPTGKRGVDDGQQREREAPGR